MRKEYIEVAGIAVEVWRKPVKNINLAVYGPDGRVRVSVPRFTSDSCVRKAVMDRMAWVEKHQAAFRAHPPIPELQIVSGEMHRVWGKEYPLTVVEGCSRSHICFDPVQGLSLSIRSGSSLKARQQQLNKWYRSELNSRIPHLLEVWQPRVGKRAAEYRIKKMKTRWGTCNTSARRIWLNLALAQKPAECLEYILVHELLHLVERNHNARFYKHMDRLLPDWQAADSLLNMKN